MTEARSAQSAVVSLESALARLAAAPEKFVELFAHGTLSVEIYRPGEADLQQPHDRDEVYVVVSGEGRFLHGGQRTRVRPGDLLFVPAFMEHRFVDFTPDLTVWVLFYGPEGGEAP
jgi:mannose-6-phosphate isomerase-like protein (cupin superfamily)